MRKHRIWVAVFASLAVAGWSQNSAVIVESYSDGLNSGGFSALEGKWTASEAKSTAEGLKATKSVFNDANAEAATARFTPELPAAGKYEVFVTYPESGNATDVNYTIHTADGDQHLQLTQFGREASHRPAANTWYSLGIYNFNAGKDGYVEVSDPLTGERPQSSEPNARIYADAVKFVPAPESAQVAALQPAPSPSAAATAVETAGAATTTAPGAMQELSGEAIAGSLPPTPAPQVAAAAPGLPSLPQATPALPSLPADNSSAAAVPSLPVQNPAANLPPLPGMTPATTGLPSLPASTPANAAGLPSLPAATPASAAGLPSLPVTPGTAGALPGLPAADPASGLPSLPAAPTPAAPLETPSPITDLPSLAPVTPTPVPQLPSPSDTPVPAPPVYDNQFAIPATPAPTPGIGIGTGLAVPTPIPSGTALPAAAPSPTPGGYSITTYNPSNLPWMYDFGAALKTARDQSKKVLVFFTSEFSRTAQAYETQTFNDPAVRQALEKYVLVKADFSRNTRLAYSLGVFGSGVVAVVDSTGAVTSRVVQRPDSSAQFLTELSTAKPVRATPAPGSATPAPADANVAPNAMPAVDMATTAEATLPAGTPDAGMPSLAIPPAAPATEATPAAAQPADAMPSLPGLPDLPQ